MERLRRYLKIFWTEHGTPILFYTIVIVVVILIIQGLNALAIQNSKQNKNSSTNNTTNEVKTISAKENKVNKELINRFIEYCKANKTKEAYELLSENCKKDLYPTINDFINKYYKDRFTKGYETKISHDADYIYKVQFFQNSLETGESESSNAIKEDLYKIDLEIVEDKLYINYSKSRK